MQTIAEQQGEGRQGRLRFAVPGIPPSVNHMYVRRRARYYDKRGRPRMRVMNVLTKTARAYAQKARLCPFADDTEGRKHLRCARKTEKVRLHLWFYWPDNRRRDWHNGLKLLLDSWEGVLYEDDKDARPQLVDEYVDRRNPRIVVEVEYESPHQQGLI